MDKIKPVVKLDDDDFGAILNCAVRYAIGRQTYMPSLVISYITPLLPYITNKTLGVFKRDYESATSYGDVRIDKPMWDKFYAAVCEEINRRNKEE